MPADPCDPFVACINCAGREPGTPCTLTSACSTGNCNASFQCIPLTDAPCGTGGKCNPSGACDLPVTTTSTSTTSSTTLASDAANPGALLIYYGFPNSLNFPQNGFAPDDVAADLGQYDYVVLGDEVELDTLDSGECDCNGIPTGPSCHVSAFGNECGHPDYPSTTTILAHPAIAGTKVFGYVDVGVSTQNLSLAELQRRIDLWDALGVAGIFLDDFGYDFCVTRERQNQVVGHAHDRGLAVIANAFVPGDAFGSNDAPNPCGGQANPGAVAPALGGGDFYLFESHQVRLGAIVAGPDWQAKAEAIEALQQGVPFGVLSVTTNAMTAAYDEPAFFYAWYSAAMYGHVATGWGEYEFSTQPPVNALAPFRARPLVSLGSTLVGGTTPAGPNASLYCRETDAGSITVDVVTRAAGFAPGGTCASPTTTSTTGTTSTSTTTSTSSTSAPTSTTSATAPTTTSTLTSTSTSLPSERCDNCVDDDHDGLVDFFDPACCDSPARLTLQKTRLTPEEADGLPATRLLLNARVGGVALSANTAIVVQIAPGNGGTPLCAVVPAEAVTAIRRGIRFDDHDIPATRGIERIRMKTNKRGRATIQIRGHEVRMPTPAAGTVAFRIALRSSAGADGGNQCLRAEETFRAGRRRALRFP